MLRSARHAKILEIISHKEIETQEELCAELNALNHAVTQATISRDIRDLHLFKVAGIEKKYILLILFLGVPFVKVSVLSRTTVSMLCSCSNACAFLSICCWYSLNTG